MLPGYWRGSNVWLPVSAKRGGIWALKRTASALGLMGDIAHPEPVNLPHLRAVHLEAPCVVDDLGLLQSGVICSPRNWQVLRYMLRRFSSLSSVSGVPVAQRFPGCGGFCRPFSSGVHTLPTQPHRVHQQTFDGLFYRSNSTGWRDLLRNNASRKPVSVPARGEIECWLKAACFLQTS